MPCYLVNTISLSFKAANRGLIALAASKLGLQFMNGTTLKTKDGRYIYIDGENARCDQRDAKLVNDLRIAYAQEVVGHVSNKLGWQKTETKPNNFLIKKGGW